MISRYKNVVDLYFTDDGDFVLDQDSYDFKDTMRDQYRGLIQTVNTRMRSNKGEWNLQREVGANLSDFFGKNNTAEIGNQIQNRVINTLIKGGLIAPKDLEVIVLPTSKFLVAIIVVITPPGVAEKIILTYTYNTRDNHTLPRNL